MKVVEFDVRPLLYFVQLPVPTRFCTVTVKFPGGAADPNVIVNVVDHGMALSDAVAAPRIHEQALPDVIVYERGGLTQAAVDGLRSMGYELHERGRIGDIAAIQRTAAGWVGVADPRRGGGAAGY